MPKSGVAATPMSHKDAVTHLVGDGIRERRPFPPYEPFLCEFLNDLSKELRAGPDSSAYPDVMAFAFWCRKGNIERFKSAFESREARLGLGLVFHITPSNVPVTFAFSYVFGLLAGNANIVRVPSKPFPQVGIICEGIRKVVAVEKYKDIEGMTSFVRYEQNDEITREFSASCNARLIWGGDEAIRKIREMPLPERSLDLVFSDRYSLCVISAPSVNQLKEVELIRLCERFYNDTFYMDQNACSSPHLIVWQGEGKEAAKERFWRGVHETVREKEYHLAAVTAVDKYTMLCENAIEISSIQSVTKHDNLIYRLALHSVPEEIDRHRGRAGYFFEYDTDDLNRIAHIINTRYQTLTYFGVDREELLRFVIGNRLSGLDRIVPVGTALDMDIRWDGYDIVRTLSRIIDVK